MTMGSKRSKKRDSTRHEPQRRECTSDWVSEPGSHPDTNLIQNPRIPPVSTLLFGRKKRGWVLPAVRDHHGAS